MDIYEQIENAEAVVVDGNLAGEIIRNSNNGRGAFTAQWSNGSYFVCTENDLKSAKVFSIDTSTFIINNSFVQFYKLTPLEMG
jgi:hypothetical protein